MTRAVEQSTAIQGDRIFYTGMAAAALVTVFAAFAQTYYLRPHDWPGLSPLLQVHGLVFTSWMLLFAAQTTLIASHRTDAHRRTGLASTVLAAAVVIVGSVVAVDALRRGLGTSFGIDPRTFFAAPVAEMLCFGTLVMAGVAYRRHAEVHKRLMLLATVSLIKPAIARFVDNPIVVFMLADIFVVAAAVYDLSSRKRIHPALIFGGLLIVVGKPFLFAIGHTPAWLAFADLLR